MVPFNQKDVSVGLMDLYVAFKDGRQELTTVRPRRARLQIMQPEGNYIQSPFVAATLPSQQVVVIWMEGHVSGEARSALPLCDRAELVTRLSTGKVQTLGLARYE